MSTDQWDAEQVVRIRMKHRDDAESWSRRLARREAERDVSYGSTHLAIEHAKGREVISAKIVPWTFN